MNKAVRLRSTRRAGALQMSPLPPWESAAAAAHSTIAGLQRGTRPTAPASWSAGRERRFARQKAGLHPAVHKASAARGGATAVLCRLEERDALWGTQNDNMGGNKFLKQALRPPCPKSRAAPMLPRGPEPPEQGGRGCADPPRSSPRSRTRYWSRDDRSGRRASARSGRKFL